MIQIYEGRPGSGKSYCATQEIAKALAQGRWVYTNCAVKEDAMREFVAHEYGVTFQDGSYPLVIVDDGFACLKAFYSQMPRGSRELPSLGVLDEAQNFLNARDWKTNHFEQRDLLVYLSQHRKLHHDLIFITQEAENIDAQVRRLSQSYFRFRDLQRLSLPIVGRLWSWPHSLMVNLDYGGKLVLGRRFLMRIPSIFRVYESEALLMDNNFINAGSPIIRIIDNQQRNKRLLDKLCLPLSFCILAVAFLVFLIG